MLHASAHHHEGQLNAIIHFFCLFDLPGHYHNNLQLERTFYNATPPSVNASVILPYDCFELLTLLEIAASVSGYWYPGMKKVHVFAVSHLLSNLFYHCNAAGST